MGEDSSSKRKGKTRQGSSRWRKAFKLLRLAVLVGGVVWLVQKRRSASRPAGGLWRDSFSPGGHTPPS